MIPRFLNGLYWAEAILAVTAFSGVALALTADVIGRELFGNGIYGAQKFAVYCTAVAGMTGFALVVAKGGHLRPKFFDRIVPQRYDAQANRIADLTAAIAGLKAALATHVEGSLAEALHARDELLPAMDAVRAAADALESIVADDLWPLPTYQEMLFIL